MTLLHSLASVTLTLTPIILLLLLLTPLFDRKYSAAGRHLLWIFVMAGLCLPLISFAPRPAIQIDLAAHGLLTHLPQGDDASIPSYSTEPLNTPDELSVRDIQGGLEAQITQDYSGAPARASQDIGDIFEPAGRAREPLRPPQIDAPALILFAWLSGVFLALAYHIGIHLSFRRFIRRWSLPVSDPGVIELFHAEAARMGISKAFLLKRCKRIKAPMLTGFIRPAVLLPGSRYDAEALRFIFRHELTHYKRRDLWYKLALAAVKSVYWFNPAVHLMAARANKDIETICDAMTVDGMDITSRKRYSEIILSMASGPRSGRGLATCFMGGKNMLKQRFANILGKTKKGAAALFIAIGAVVFAAGLLVGFNFGAEPPEPPADFFDHAAYASAGDTVNIPSMNAVPETPEPADDPKPDTNEPDSLPGGFMRGSPDAQRQLLDEHIYRSLAALDKWMEENKDAINKSPDSLAYYFTDLGEPVFNIPSHITSAITGHSLEELIPMVYDRPNMTEREFSDISAIDISAVTDHVTVTRDGDRLLVRYYEWFDGEYGLDVCDGKLSLEQNSPPYLRKGASLSDGWLSEYLRSQGRQPQNTVEIVIPASARYNKIEISTVSGVITAEGVTADKITLNTVIGNTAAKSCAADSIEISSVNGVITAEDCKTDSLKLSTVNGDGHIKLTGSAADCDISFDSWLGSLVYNGNEAGDMRNRDSARRISLSTVRGTILVEDV
ncbi:MAG: DUF4097 family beta strand repeat-containing protein [Oscillospiraceae bacterium]|nr:DUF4097 family beta strand repeat-containing protein [Oscillospiraceae bacterium]